jgi:hypothetical protein
MNPALPAFCAITRRSGAFPASEQDIAEVPGETSAVTR